MYSKAAFHIEYGLPVKQTICR